MDKREKYYTYIIKDLLRKSLNEFKVFSNGDGYVAIPTESENIEHNHFEDGLGYVSTPFEGDDLSRLIDWFSSGLLEYEIRYMVNWYGLREEEIEPLLVEYMKQLVEKIKNSIINNG